MNGLDLELSQTKRTLQKFKPQDTISPEKKTQKIITKGDLLDSLDLNIGYESI